MDSLKNPNFKQKKEKKMLNQNTKTKREIAIISIAAMIIVTSLVMIVSMIHGNSTTSISLVSKNYLEANEEKTGKVIVSYLDTFGNEIAKFIISEIRPQSIRYPELGISALPQKEV